MKKLMLVAVFGIALGFTSCGEDDVVDFVCDAVEAELRAEVEAEIAAYDAEATATTCANLKAAIDAYRENECGADDAYASQRDALPEDCSTAG